MEQKQNVEQKASEPQENKRNIFESIEPGKKVDPLMATFIQGKFEREYGKFLNANPPPSIDDLMAWIAQAQAQKKIRFQNVNYDIIDGGVLVILEVTDYEGFTHRAKIPYSDVAFKKSFLYEIDRVKLVANHYKIDSKELEKLEREVKDQGVRIDGDV